MTERRNAEHGLVDAWTANLGGQRTAALLDRLDKAVAWGEAQSPRDERGLSMWNATRARIRRDLKQFALAGVDIDAALKWWEANLPGDERGLGILRTIKASILAAEKE